MAYLLKSFSYYPLSFLIHDSNMRFPLNPFGAFLEFLKNNSKIVENENIYDNLLNYIDKLIKIEEYRKIIYPRDSLLIKGTIKGFLWFYNIVREKTSFDILITLTYINSNEATFKLITIYLNNLKKIKKKIIRWDKRKRKRKIDYYNFWFIWTFR